VNDFGIPYAFHDEDDPAVVICPECGKRIRESKRKDEESFEGREYARHYAEAHRSAITTISAP
jgi:hypothetical protein